MGSAVPEHEDAMTPRLIEHGGLRIEVDEPASTVGLRGDLDMEGGPVLETELIGLLSDSHAEVVVDLAGLEFIDSTGLQALLRANQHARENGRELRFRRGSAQVEGVMRLTRVGERLAFVD